MVSSLQQLRLFLCTFKYNFCNFKYLLKYVFGKHIIYILFHFSSPRNQRLHRVPKKTTTMPVKMPSVTMPVKLTIFVFIFWFPGILAKVYHQWPQPQATVFVCPSTFGEHRKASIRRLQMISLCIDWNGVAKFLWMNTKLFRILTETEDNQM